MSIPMKELNEEINIKQEINDDIFILGSQISKEKKLAANIPQIKCPKHPDKFITTICTFQECPYQKIFCPACLNYELIQNQLQHFNPHQKYMKEFAFFFLENQNILKIKETPEFKEILSQAFDKINSLKNSIDNEQMKKRGKVEISYFTDSIFGLHEKIENVHRGLYGRILKRNVFTKIKQTRKKKNTKGLERSLKKTKALLTNYLNNFLNKSKDVSFLDKIDKILDFLKNKHLKIIETEMQVIKEGIIEIEEEENRTKNNEKFDFSEEEKVILKSLNKIKKEINIYKKNPRNYKENIEEKQIKLEKNI